MIKFLSKLPTKASSLHRHYPVAKMFCLAVAAGISVIATVNTAQAGDKDAPVKKLPPFAQIDKNGDHFITKDELSDYPVALQYFDRVDVDAGKDGKLEQHEYENLVMDTKREREQK